MSDTRSNAVDVLTYIAESGCVVSLTVGHVVDGRVHHDAIVIHEAPPKVTNEVISRFNFVSVVDGGLHIPVEDMRKR